MYRTIETSFWDDPKVANLNPQAKLLFVYLITNRHSHVSGIYYLPDGLIADEIGVNLKQLDTLWHTLSDLGLSWRDKKTHVVYVKNMFRYQGRGDKNLRAAANNIKTLHNSILINKFIENYPEIKRYGIDRVSDRYSQIGIQEQEQYKEQEQEQETTLASSDENPSLSACDVFCELPCNGNGHKTFIVQTCYIDEMKKAYPGVDVESETLRAKAWLISNPQKRKTHTGMTRFLNFWYSRNQNKLDYKKPEQENYFDRLLQEEDK